MGEHRIRELSDLGEMRWVSGNKGKMINFGEIRLGLSAYFQIFFETEGFTKDINTPRGGRSDYGK